MISNDLIQRAINTLYELSQQVSHFHYAKEAYDIIETTKAMEDRYREVIDLARDVNYELIEGSIDDLVYVPILKATIPIQVDAYAFDGSALGITKEGTLMCIPIEELDKWIEMNPEVSAKCTG